MEIDALIPLFNHFKTHIALTAGEEAFIASKVSARRLAKGELLLEEGQINRYQNFVIRGCLKTYRMDGSGKERILTFSLENWWAGDLYSFLSENPSRYFVEALEESQVVRLSKPALLEFYQQMPQFNMFFRILLEKAFIAQQERIMGNLSDSAEERYLKLKVHYPAFEQRIPLKQLALYLGITPQFLSMLRKKMSRKALSSTS